MSEVDYNRLLEEQQLFPMHPIGSSASLNHYKYPSDLVLLRVLKPQVSHSCRVQSFICGTLQSVMGVLFVFLNGASIGLLTPNNSGDETLDFVETESKLGIGSGLVFIVTGIFGIVNGIESSIRKIALFTAGCILSLIISLVSVVCYIRLVKDDIPLIKENPGPNQTIGTTLHHQMHEYVEEEVGNSLFAIFCTLLVVCLMEVVLSCWGSVLGGRLSIILARSKQIEAVSRVYTSPVYSEEYPGYSSSDRNKCESTLMTSFSIDGAAGLRNHSMRSQATSQEPSVHYSSSSGVALTSQGINHPQTPSSPISSDQPYSGSPPSFTTYPHQSRGAATTPKVLCPSYSSQAPSSSRS